ncbi:hypothetical protein D3C73_940010 [compost metagenome]
MLVIDYDPHCVDKPLDSDVVPSFVQETLLEYRQLPLTEELRQPTHRVYISTVEVLRTFVKYLAKGLVGNDFRIVMGNRAVYFLFLKKLFSDCPEPEHEQLSFIFRNSKSSFAV